VKRSVGILVLCACLIWPAPRASAGTIAEAKEIDANGTPVRIGQVVTVSGVVTVSNGTFSDRDLDVHIEDGTAGLLLYLRNGADIEAALGDSVVGTGIVDQEGRTSRRNDTKLSLLSAGAM